MELLSEKIHTKVALLASLRGSGNADDLADMTLKDEEVASADVVGGDANSSGTARTAIPTAWARIVSHRSWR